MSNYPRGSEWRRWDLHVHTPETILNNQYKNNDWQIYIEKLNESDIAVVGITDYLCIENYKKIHNDKHKLRKDLFIIPNIEFRITPETKNNNAINLHLLINPFDKKHIEKTEKALKKLEVEFSGEKYECSIEDLKKLGNGSLPEGVKQFKVSFDTFKKWLNEQKWLKNNSLLAVSNSSNDGVSGLRDSGFYEARKDFYYNVDLIFSSNPNDIEYFLGKGVDTRSEIISKYNSIKACVHGSDAHCYEKMFSPDNDRYCWIKADPNFAGLKQAINEPDRIFIGEIPPSLDRIKKNKIKILETLKITHYDNYDGTQGQWFKDAEINFNGEMTAIIGNKGSGKTAIAEIIALLSNCKNEGEFIFLEKEKFRKKNLASNFNASLSWADSVQIKEKNLGSNVNPNSEELIHFVPQKSFEKYCNDSDEDFISEINNVVFSRMDDNERLKCKNFNELIENQKSAIKEKKDELSIAIKNINVEIKKLEEKNDINYKTKKEESLKTLKLEEKEHVKNKPLKVLPPADLNTPDYQKLAESKKAIDGTIKEKEEAKADLIKKHSELSLIKDSIVNFKSTIEAKNLEIKTQLESFEISFSEIFSYNFDIKIIEKTLRKITKKITDIDEKIKTSENINECGEFIKQKREIEQKINEYNNSNAGKLTQYQKYQTEKESWDKKNIEIKDKIDSLKKDIKYIGDFKNSNLVKDINDKREERLAITKQIYECFEKESEIYSKFKEKIVAFIESHKSKMDDYNVSIEAGIYIKSDFSRTFVDKYINSLPLGPFRAPEGNTKIKNIVDASNTDSWEGVKNLLYKLQKEFDDFDNENKSFHCMFKKDKYDDFYTDLFNLKFLNPRYSLRLYGKELNELSPGERGSLLLVFYLLLDARDIPLVLDQPEDNLDNESVAKILVPFIREAKKRRQIIIITHNSNLAVVSDAEQIIRVSIDKKNQNAFTHKSGSLESNVINDVIDVLEGTRSSFDIRNNKYIITGV